jgi:hypothetical protein
VSPPRAGVAHLKIDVNGPRGTEAKMKSMDGLFKTVVICQEEMVATFCNVATGPNNAGYGTHGGAAATSTGIATPSKAIPACGEGVVPANELCN